MQTLSCGMHVGSSSLPRDQTRGPCIGSTEPQPLDHQGSPAPIFNFNFFNVLVFFVTQGSALNCYPVVLVSIVSYGLWHH